MAFVRKKTKVFPWKVSIASPSSTVAGELETEQITVKFKRLGGKELADFDKLSEDKALETAVQGWEGVTEEDGTDIPFNKKNLHEVADDLAFRNAVISAYKEFIQIGLVKN